MLNVSPLRTAKGSELWGTDARAAERRRRGTKLVVLSSMPHEPFIH